MNYDYNCGELFLEITFPTMSVTKLLIKPTDILKIKEYNQKNGKKVVLTEITIKIDNKQEVYYYDGKLEEFKKDCKKVYL